MKVLNNNLLVKEIKKDNITKAGIILAGDERDYPMIEGKVINKDEYIDDVNINDIVMFGSEDAREIKVDDKKLWLVNMRDLLYIRG